MIKTNYKGEQFGSIVADKNCPAQVYIFRAIPPTTRPLSGRLLLLSSPPVPLDNYCSEQRVVRRQDVLLPPRTSHCTFNNIEKQKHIDQFNHKIYRWL